VKKALLLTLMASLAFLALVLAAAPSLLLIPSRDQTPGSLAMAFRLTKIAPLMTLALALVALALAFGIWRLPRRAGARSGLLHAVLLALLVVPTLAAAALSRSALAERMFTPIGELHWVVGQAANEDGEQQIMGIEIQGQARAYPVRIVGYHHIIHDTVGGEPVVATY